MLTDTQQSGLLLSLTMAERLGVSTEPWERKPMGDMTGALGNMGFYWVGSGDAFIDPFKCRATPEHYDARCAVYARELMNHGGRYVRRFSHAVGWSSWFVCGPVMEQVNCPDDELTALVHALAAAKGVEG